MHVPQHLIDRAATEVLWLRIGPHPGAAATIEDLAFRVDALLNEALDESFPASDPLSSLHAD